MDRGSVNCEEDILGMPPDLAASLAAFSHPLNNQTGPLSSYPTYGGASSLGGGYPFTSFANFGSHRPYSTFGAARGRHEDEPLNYHHPRTKHYDDKMEKQRLEHILFAGSDCSPLDRQKERMRRKLRSKLDRKRKPQSRSTEHGRIAPDDSKHSEPSLPSNTKKANVVDKRRRKKNRSSRRKGKGATKARNKKGGANHKKGAHSTASPPSSLSSVSPQCKSMDNALKELEDDLTLCDKTVEKWSAAMSKLPKSTNMKSDATADTVDGVGSDAFESSVDRDIDDGDHEDSFIRQLEAEDALLEQLEAAKTAAVQTESAPIESAPTEAASTEEAPSGSTLTEDATLCLTVDDDEGPRPMVPTTDCEEVTASTMSIVQRQNAEIEMLKESVSTLIETVSNLEELVLFHKSNAMPSPPPQDGHQLHDCQAMAEEIESLKERVHDLECGSLSHCGSEHEALRRWLTDEVALGQYVDVFIDHGFEDLVAAQTLTMDVLDAVEGIDKIGHKLRILNFVEKLKDAAEETHEF